LEKDAGMVEVSGLLDGMKDLLSLVDRLQQLPLLGQVLFCAFSLVFLVFPVVFSKIIVNKTQRIKNLKNVLSSSMILNGNVTNEVKDVMNSYYFKLATGVSAEGLRREYLIKFHEEFSYCISWGDVSLADPYLGFMQNGSPYVSFNFSDKLAFRYMQLCFCITLAFSAVMIGLPIVLGTKNLESFFISVCFGVGLLLFSVLIDSRNSSYRVALRLDGIIRNK